MKLRTRLPSKLKDEPLLEAIWQFRFMSEQQVASEVLTGKIFQGLRSDINSTERLPFGGGIPKELTDRQPSLLYAPSIRLNGPAFSVGVGQRLVSLSAKIPYCGWEKFRAKILELVRILDNTEVVGKVENFSIKYVDCLANPPIQTSLSATTIECFIADRGFKGEPTLIRTEFTELGLKHSVQVALPASVTLPDSGSKRNGIITEVETFCSPPTDFRGVNVWIEARLDEAHNANKSIFFSLLSDETINLLVPSYKDVH